MSERSCEGGVLNATRVRSALTAARRWLILVVDLKGAEFLRKLERAGKRSGTAVRLEAKRGKGSHGTVYYGSARTVIQDLKKELPKGTLHAMLTQLGLTIQDLED